MERNVAERSARGTSLFGEKEADGKVQSRNRIHGNGCTKDIL